MIRITFLVGGGKLSRSKYDAKAMQTVTSTLKQLDYDEDRGASCVLECGGCYKTQHDTNKNVLTVVVFPKVLDSGKDNNQQTNSKGEEYEPLIPTNSPGYKLAVCSLNPTFHNLLSTYCPTYLEKKECQSCIEGLLQVEQAIENKLTKGQPLDAGEQAFYDESQDLKEKYTTVQKEASKHIEDGRLTVDEKAFLVEMNEKRIQTLMAEKSSASVAEKLKKAMTRKQQLQSLTDDVLSMNVSYPPPLRHESQLTALRKKLLPLYALEEASRGRLLTLNETRLMTEKEEIEAEIERLELNSCGWFEQEDVFGERLQRSREKFDAKFARSKRSGGGGKMRSGAGGSKGGGGGNSVSKWILPGEKPKSTWGGGGKKKAKPKGGAVFTAYDAMMDSSSDEESDDEEEDSTMETRAYSASSPKKQHPASSNVLTPKTTEKKDDNTSTTNASSENNTKAKKKKKNKKKKKKSPTACTDNVQGTEESTDGPQQKVSDQETTRASSVSSSLVVFWQSFLLPLVTMILNLIVYLLTSVFNKLFGKKESKNKKRR